ncbi:MAG: FAD-binding protein [Oscillibacter sp.]|nr:FAD-binding protein [Oscillibacter sp.]
MEIRQCSVLVIGGGESGIRAAVEAKRAGVDEVILLTKGKFGSAGVMFSELTYGWDMQAATGENDSTDSTDVFFDDVMRAAQGTCSAELARVVTDEAASRVDDLVDLFGLELLAGSNGKPRQVYGCFSSKSRAYQFIHPARIKEQMKQSVDRFGVTLLEEFMAVELLKKDGVCCGAMAVSRDGKILCCLAGAVVLAAGGATGIYQHNFASPGMTGDGYSLAYRAGCSLANLEFMQFGLGVLEPKYNALFLDRILCLKPDIKFRREHRFPRPLEQMMEQHAKHFPFSCTDDSFYLDTAIFEETLENGGKGVAVDLSVIPREKLEEIPVWGLYYSWFEEEKNPYDNELSITPFAHACNGGVKINAEAMTEVPGLYAAGEMVSGPHGANRLGGYMHAACQVFGTRAGRNAARFAREHPVSFDGVVFPELMPTGKESMDLGAMRRQVGELMWRSVNVVRCEADMAAALEAVRNWQMALKEYGGPDLWEFYETRSTLLSAELILTAALARRESRGSHYRKDFPQTESAPYVLSLSRSPDGVAVRRTEAFT